MMDDTDGIDGIDEMLNAYYGFDSLGDLIKTSCSSVIVRAEGED